MAAYLIESGPAFLVQWFLELGRVHQLECGLILLVMVEVLLPSQPIQVAILVCGRGGGGGGGGRGSSHRGGGGGSRDITEEVDRYCYIIAVYTS